MNLPRRLPLLLTAFALLGVGAGTGAGSAAAATSCSGAGAPPTAAANLAAIEATTLCLLNEQRAAAGIAPLSTDGELTTAATRYSGRMVAEHFFEHVAPDGGDLEGRLNAVNYLTGLSAWSIGENIGWGSGSYTTPGAMVEGWMHSPGHRANILDADFRAIGIGIAMGAPPLNDPTAATYTTDFGSVVGGESSDPSAPDTVTTIPLGRAPKPNHKVSKHRTPKHKSSKRKSSKHPRTHGRADNGRHARARGQAARR